MHLYLSGSEYNSCWIVIPTLSLIPFSLIFNTLIFSFVSLLTVIVSKCIVISFPPFNAFIVANVFFNCSTFLITTYKPLLSKLAIINT